MYEMIKLWIKLLCLMTLTSTAAAFGLVDDGPNRDSLAIPFAPLDSVGRAVDLADGDSVYLVVFSPGGNVVFKDSMDYDDAGIKNCDWEDYGGGRAYTYAEKISVLTGGSNSRGVYTYTLEVQDNTAADLSTRCHGQFQVINSPVDALLDSAAYARQAVDSLSVVLDSLYAVLDSLQNQDDWIADSGTVTGAVIAAMNADTTMALKGLRIIADAETDTAVYVKGHGAGHGLLIRSGGNLNAHAVWCYADSGNAVKAESGKNCAVTVTTYADSGASALNITHEGNISAQLGTGIRIKGPVSGDGFGVYILGPESGYGDAVRLETFGPSTGNVATMINNGAGDVVQMRTLGTGEAIDIQSGQVKYGDTVWVKIDDSLTPIAVLADSAHFQGTAAGLDSATVYGAVAQVVEDSSLTAGSGSGLYSFNITVFDSASSQVVPGVDIVVRNMDQTALVAVGETGSDGAVAFNLDADTFIVIGFSPGYIFESHDTIGVVGAGDDTLYGYQFNPGEPGSPDLCRVYGFLYDIGGGPEEGASVSAWLPSGVTASGSGIISPFRIETASDSTGYFYIDLIPSADLDQADARYEISIRRTDGTILRERVIVPDSTSWLLTW